MCDGLSARRALIRIRGNPSLTLRACDGFLCMPSHAALDEDPSCVQFAISNGCIVRNHARERDKLHPMRYEWKWFRLWVWFLTFIPQMLFYPRSTPLGICKFIPRPLISLKMQHLRYERIIIVRQENKYRMLGSVTSLSF